MTDSARAKIQKRFRTALLNIYQLTPDELRDLLEEAISLIGEHEGPITLSAEDSRVLLEHLENPPEPNAALRKLFAAGEPEQFERVNGLGGHTYLVCRRCRYAKGHCRCAPESQVSSREPEAPATDVSLSRIADVLAQRAVSGKASEGQIAFEILEALQLAWHAALIAESPVSGGPETVSVRLLLEKVESIVRGREISDRNDEERAETEAVAALADHVRTALMYSAGGAETGCPELTPEEIAAWQECDAANKPAEP